MTGGVGSYYLKAKVYGDEIDWKSTFYCNSALEEEHEIRLKEGEIIEIVGYYNSSKKYFSFKNPLYIKA